MAKDDQKEKDEKKEQTKKKSKGKGMSILFLAGGFLLSFAVICVGMYFILKMMQPEIPLELVERTTTSDGAMSVDSPLDSVPATSVPEIDLSEFGLPEDSLLPADQVKIAIAELLSKIDNANNQVAGVQVDLNEKNEVVDSLNGELEELLALEDGLDRKRVTRLAKILESMKPQEAAPLMGQLTDDLNVAILMKMKERPAGKILSEMPVSRAAAISRLISQKVLEG